MWRSLALWILFTGATSSNLVLNVGDVKPVYFNFPRLQVVTPQKISVTTSPGNSIILQCETVNLGKGMADSCDGYLIVRESNGKWEKLCDSLEHYYYRADGGSLEIEMQGDPMYKTYSNCTVEAKKTSEVGSRPAIINPYYEEDSEEIDSSEYGAVPGKKKTTCPCGWSNKAGKRIVGGREAQVNEYSFIVALIDVESEDHYCGGAILTKRFVLTAAHCTEDMSYQDILVEVGAHYIRGDIEDNSDIHQTIGVEAIHEHEEYHKKRRVYMNDIALLELDEDIAFSRLVGPVCMSHTRIDLVGKYVRNIGWGRLGYNRNASTVLMKVDLRVITLDSCRQRTHLAHPTLDFQICSYSTGRSTCGGDSGGPTLWLDPETNRYTQVGLVSTGQICGMYRPNVDINVPHYYDWIHNVIKEARPDDNMCFKAV